MSGGTGGSASATGGLSLSSKGDLLTFNTAEARLPVSVTNGHVLTTNSAVADGIEWAAPAGAPTTSKGDLSGYSSTQARIPVGSNFKTLQAKSSDALGLSWEPSSTSVLTTAGDLLYASSANTLARLAKGSDNQILKMNGSALNWETPAASGTVKHTHGDDTDAEGGLMATMYTKKRNIPFNTTSTNSMFYESNVGGSGSITETLSDMSNTKIVVKTGGTSGSRAAPRWYMGVGYLGDDCSFGLRGALANSTSDMNIFIGFKAGYSSYTRTEQQFGFFADGANYQAVTANGSNYTATDTGMGVGWAPKYLVAIKHGSSVFFYVNGVLKATHTTNLPTGGGGEYGAFISNQAASDKTVELYPPYWATGSFLL